MRRPAIVVAVALALLPSIAVAQTMGGKGRGLDALDEQQVMGRLATDGLTGLLDRDFDVFKVPPAERDQQMAVVQLTRLANAAGLKPADRRALAERVARGIDPLVAKATNAAALQQQAYELTASGLTPTVTELEYFGDNPVAQQQLRPVAETVKHMFQKVNELVGGQVRQIVAVINNSNVAQQQVKLRALRPLRVGSAFSDHMTSYALCISLPKDDPQRKVVADEAIEYLKQFDNPRSSIQPGVRNQMGKLQLAEGDYAGAKATLQSVADGTDIQPAPTGAEQNDARYFAAVADLLAGKLDDTAADAKALDQWQQVNYLPKLEPAQQDQVRAAGAMLNFRLASARADAAADPDQKRQFNDQAVTILSDLLQQQNDPTLRDLVFDQMVTRIPEQPDLAKLNPLALSALLQQGFDEFNKKEGEPVNRPVLERAVAAARELSARAGQPGVNQVTAVNAAYFVPYALEVKLRDDPAAAAAYMDFMERYPAETDKAQDCLEHAGKLVFDMHKAAVARNAPDPAEAQLYDRFLSLAVNPPYDRKDVALDYADVLRGQGRYLDAVKYYAMVPTGDRRYGAAQFRELLALYSALSDTTANLPKDQRAQVARQLQDVAAGVDGTAAAAAAAAKDDADRQRELGQVAIARYDAAISARRDLKDPAKSLRWLDGFEDKIAGLKSEPAFAQTVIVQRVNAYMDQGKTSDATAQLVTLLQSDPAAGEGLMFDLIHQIDHDLDAAKGAKDAAAERQLAANKAQLSGFLVTYAQTSKDPKTQGQLPAYRLYDADSKRQAAELTDDPAARSANLDAALAQYRALSNGDDTPPAVLLGIGLTEYDLGHYKEAEAGLSPLVSKRLIGQPTMDVDGHTVENPQFWEATYKQLRSIYEVAKANPNDPEAKDHLAKAKPYLSNLFIIYGNATGGAGYHDDFVQLRDEMK
jgi:hypothetical protein